MNGDRYFFDGLIKISKPIILLLKGMNNNYLTNTKEYDYRFLGRLITEVFGKDVLENGCVKSNVVGAPCQYELLDAKKFDFVKGELFFQMLTIHAQTITKV